MGYKKPANVTEMDLCNAPLPTHKDTYTVIPHSLIINQTNTLLQKFKLRIKSKVYKCNANAKVAQGIYYLEPQNVGLQKIDDELGLMFAWTNSYDKSVRFQCGIGAYVFVCNNGMIHGDMATYSRKHTGTADIEAKMQLQAQIQNASKHFNQLLRDRDLFRGHKLTCKEQAELLGRLYIEEEIIDVSQLVIAKKEMNKPSYNYNCDLENAWTFYNNITHALKTSHPRNWMSDQQEFHKFMTSELLSNVQLHVSDNPNQLSILEEDTIEEASSMLYGVDNIQ